MGAASRNASPGPCLVLSACIPACNSDLCPLFPSISSKRPCMVPSGVGLSAHSTLLLPGSHTLRHAAAASVVTTQPASVGRGLAAITSVFGTHVVPAPASTAKPALLPALASAAMWTTTSAPTPVPTLPRLALAAVHNMDAARPSTTVSAGQGSSASTISLVPEATTSPRVGSSTEVGSLLLVHFHCSWGFCGSMLWCWEVWLREGV